MTTANSTNSTPKTVTAALTAANCLTTDFLALPGLVHLGGASQTAPGVTSMKFVRNSSLVALISAAAVSAHAALPAGVETAVTTAQTDGLSAVGLLAAMGAAIFLIKKVLTKLGIL